MNDVDPQGSEHTSEPKTTPNNAEVYQHHKDGHNGGPQKQYTHNELYEAIRTFWRGAVKGWKETEFHHRVEIVLAGVVALATIAYVIVASCTLSVIKSGSVDTRILAEAAKAQADVAKSQAEPLLHMSDWIGFFHLEQSKRMMVELKFQNDGKANAAAISIAIKLEFRDTAPTQGERKFTDSDFKRPIEMLPPFDPTGGGPVRFSKHDMEDYPSLKNRGTRFYVWGEISYWNIWGDRMEPRAFCGSATVKQILGTQAGDPDELRAAGFKGTVGYPRRYVEVQCDQPK